MGPSCSGSPKQVAALAEPALSEVKRPDRQKPPTALLIAPSACHFTRKELRRARCKAGCGCLGCSYRYGYFRSLLSSRVLREQKLDAERAALTSLALKSMGKKKREPIRLERAPTALVIGK